MQEPFPRRLVVENPPAVAGDARAVGSIPGWWWWCCFLSVCVCVISVFHVTSSPLSDMLSYLLIFKKKRRKLIGNSEQ